MAQLPITVDVPVATRIHDMVRWGYIATAPDCSMYLTEKGWRAFLACAEPPVGPLPRGKIV